MIILLFFNSSINFNKIKTLKQTLMSLTVLFEDDYIICVSKPNNAVVHHAYHSRNVSEEESLLQLLFNQFGAKFYPIHRLDRKLQGLYYLQKKRNMYLNFKNYLPITKFRKHIMELLEDILLSKKSLIRQLKDVILTFIKKLKHI